MVGSLFLFISESRACQALECDIFETGNYDESKFEELKLVRNRLGIATNFLLSEEIPQISRHQRSFRAKYSSENNLKNVENSLVSNAYKVVDASFKDELFLSIRPFAQNLLDSLAKVQTAVSIAAEKAIKHDLMSFILKQDTSLNKSSLLNLEPDSTIAQTSSHSEITFNPDEATTGQENQNLQLPDSGPPSLPQADRTGGQLSPTSSLLQSTFCNGTWTPILKDDMLPFDHNQMMTSQHWLTTIVRPDNLLELLIELDNSMAVFEFEFVTFMLYEVRGKSETIDIHKMIVLFSETIQWALAVGLVSQSQLANQDPLLMVSLPRLAIFVGCRMLVDCPIGARRLANGSRLPFLVSDSAKELSYLSRQLAALQLDQLWHLACWLSPVGISEADSSCISASSLQPKGRAKGSAIINIVGLHMTYKCIATVADRMAFHHPVEFRDILQTSIKLNVEEETGLSPPVTQSSRPYDWSVPCYVFDWIKVVSIPRAILLGQLSALDESPEIGVDVALMEHSSSMDHKTTCPVATSSDVGNQSHPLFSCWLTRNASVEGYFDCCFGDSSGLPPWQPDCPAGRQGTTSSEESEASESEGEESSTAGQRWSRIARIGRECAGCRAKFNFFRRRHHCRRCGHIFCASCCSTWTSIEAVSPSLRVRVCSECADFVGSARLSPGEAHTHLE